MDAEYNYIVCPHTAIAWQALKDYQKAHPDNDATGIFLSTAHPCKFPDVFPDAIAEKIVVPQQVQELEDKPKQSVILGKGFEEFKGWLLANA